MKATINDCSKLYPFSATEQAKETDMEHWWEDLTEECRLMNLESWQAKVR